MNVFCNSVMTKYLQTVFFYSKLGLIFSGWSSWCWWRLVEEATALELMLAGLAC